jgi:predicted Co/Zn/Cd cation transporter (cation efflux family)
MLESQSVTAIIAGVVLPLLGSCVWSFISKVAHSEAIQKGGSHMTNSYNTAFLVVSSVALAIAAVLASVAAGALLA